MSEPPRRRRSAPQRRAARPANILPTIALGIGVVVAGLGIGAFLSALHRDNVVQPSSTIVDHLTVTPVPRASLDALALRTPVPHRTTTPAPSAAPSASPRSSATPTPTPTPSTHASATPTPSVRPSASVSPRATPSARPAGTAFVTPRAMAAPSAAMKIVTAPPRPPSFSGQAEATVRGYLDALIAGNDAGAYASFGAAPGDPNVRLTEGAFVDRTSRIVSVRTTRADATGATVEAEVTSSHGSYFATYHVSRGPNGAIIDGHDYIRE